MRNDNDDDDDCTRWKMDEARLLEGNSYSSESCYVQTSKGFRFPLHSSNSPTFLFNASRHYDMCTLHSSLPKGTYRLPPAFLQRPPPPRLRFLFLCDAVHHPLSFMLRQPPVIFFIEKNMMHTQTIWKHI